MTTVSKNMLMAVMLGSFLMVSAQSYYDDDIYYDASKAPKVEKKVSSNRAVKKANTYQAIPGSDAYVVYTDNTRDVDEYNRRGSYRAVDNSSAADSLSLNDFKYTRKIEKYYNPEVVTGSGDEELMYYYANTDNQNTPTQVNIYVDSPDYWNPYFYSSAWSWAWNRPAYMNPWYYNNPWLWDAWTWGPSFSWSWGWGPSWTWGPSFGWSWGWGPSYGWGWGPAYGWGGHIWHRPGHHAGPGASRPVRNHNPRYSVPGNPMRNGRYGGGNSIVRNPSGVASSRPGRIPSSSVSSSRPTGGGRGTGSAVTRPGSNVNRPGSAVSRPGSGSVSRPYNPTNANRPTGTYIPQNNNGGRAGNSGSGSYSGGRRSSSTQHNSYNQNSNSQHNSYNRSSSQGSYRNSGTGGSFGGRSGGGYSGGSGRSGGRSGGRR